MRLYACLHVSEGVRAREQEGHERNGNDLAREVLRKRVTIYFSRRRYDDRAIGRSTKERTREQRKMRDFSIDTQREDSCLILNQEEKTRFDDYMIYI